jgi:uncharacterized protein (DUF433 family)
MSTVSKEHITKTPGVCGGKACIAGTRIRVMDIVALDRQGLSPNEIVDQYPSIALADVFAALTYYHDNTEEIEALFDEDRKWDEHGSSQPSKLKQFRDRHAG